MACPDEDVLLALAEGRLAPVPPPVEAHLDGCSICREVVIGIAGSDAQPFFRELEDAADEVAWIRETPGRYEVLGEAGRGGQSRVLRVFDRQIGREVALKEFRPPDPARQWEPSVARGRCLREVRVAGALSHPAILPVHEVGLREDGTPYYTMPLIEGQTLFEVVVRTRELAQRLRLLPAFVQVCQAIGFAHASGFLHRDIKPDNVLLGAFGETRIIDWGLARAPGRSGTDADRDDALAVQHAVVGTPAYMSPEQAAGRLLDLDERADVWGLGAMLFFVLTGRSPYRGAGPTEILDRVQRGDRRSLSASDGQIAPELRAVVERAMAPHPALRYPSAAALADDVIAYQSGGRVSAHAYAWPERIALFARRHRALLAGVGTVVTVLAVAIVVVTTMYRREAAAHAQADQALQQAETARIFAERARTAEYEQAQVASHNLARAYVEKAERLRADAHPLSATHHAALALEASPTHRHGPRYDPAAAERFSDGRTVDARALALLLQARGDAIERVGPRWSLERSGTIREVDHARGAPLVYAVADGRESVLVRELDESEVVARLDGHEGGAVDIALSAKGRYAVTLDAAGELRVWDVATSRAFGGWPGDGGSAAVSDAGDAALLHTDGGLLLLRAGAAVPHMVAGPRGPGHALRFSGNGRWLAVADAAGHTTLVAVEGAVVSRAWTTHDTVVTDLAFGPADERLAISGADGKIVVVALDGAAPDVVLSGHRGSVTSIAFSGDGHRLFTSASDGYVRAFDIETRALLFEVEGPSGHIYEVAYDEAAHRVVAFGRDEIGTWDLRRVDPTHRFAKDSMLVNGAVVAWGDTLLVPHLRRSSLGRLHVREARADVLELATASPPMRIAVMGETGIVTSHSDGTVIVWREDGSRLQAREQWRGPASMPVGLAASEHGPTVALDAGDGRIALWRGGEDAPTLLAEHRQRVLSLAFSADGRFLASAGFDGKVVVWDPTSGERLAVLLEADGVAEAVRFSGDVVAAAGEMGVRTWSVEHWTPGPTFSAAAHRDVRFSPTGDAIAGLSVANEVTVWDLATAMPVVIRRSQPAPQGIVFDPGGDGLWILTRRAIERQLLDRGPLGVPARELVRRTATAAGLQVEVDLGGR
jgi:eukaryotic-like serine/threonine-protein kinase